MIFHIIPLILCVFIACVLIAGFIVAQLIINSQNKKKISDLESIIKIIRKELFGLMYSTTTKDHDHCISECKDGIHQWRYKSEYNELFDWLICKECGIKCLCLKKYIDDTV